VREAELFALPGAARRTLRLAALCAVLAAASAILLLGLSGWFLTGAALAGAGGAAAVGAFNYLLPSAAIRALAIIRTASRYGERLLGHRAALTALAELRARLFAGLAAQDSRTAPDFSGGDASARLIGDIGALEDLLIRRPTRPASLAAAAVAVALAALAGWRAALLLGAALAALPLLLTLAGRALTRAPAARLAAATAELRDAFVEFAAARPEILSCRAGPRVAAVLTHVAGKADAARAALMRAEGALAGLLLCYGGAVAAGLLALAAGPAPRAALAVLAGLAAVEAMAALGRTALRHAEVREGLARLQDLLHLPPAPPIAAAPAAPAPLGLGEAVFAPGARIALLGPSGSGKTRAIEALAGLRAPVHALSLAGQPLGDCPAAALTRQFALAGQDAPLIAGTIADNLRLARPRVTADDMHAALAVAGLDDRVAALPDGLDTWLGDGGGSLSGGERKRLALARALLAERPWLLLDEPSEGLDEATEAALVARLRQWLDARGAGLVIASHRPAPLALAHARIDVAALPALSPPAPGSATA